MTAPRYIHTIGLTLVAALFVVIAPVQAESQEVSPEDRAAIQAGPVLTPYIARRPALINRNEVIDATMIEYRALLRGARVGGRVSVWFYISDAGRVLHSEIHESSGHEALDQAALGVASVYEFSPALDGAEPVPVWIQLPITFRVRERLPERLIEISPI